MRNNNQAEQRMVNAVKRNYPELCKETESSRKVQGQTDKCDLAIQFNGITYFLEVKHSNKSNTANYAKQMLTECMINRKHHGTDELYGILVDKDAPAERCLLNYVKRYIVKEDWVAFGKRFNCAMIFFFDEKIETLYYMKWGDLFDNNPPTQIAK